MRKDYLTKGKLCRPASLLQLLIFIALMSLPCVYNTPEWAAFWRFENASELWLGYLGFFLIVLGFIVACAMLETPEDYHWGRIENAQENKAVQTVRHGLSEFESLTEQPAAAIKT